MNAAHEKKRGSVPGRAQNRHQINLEKRGDMRDTHKTSSPNFCN